jgi:hypothetical protein
MRSILTAPFALQLEGISRESLINKLRGLSPLVNYAVRATAACWRS